MSHSNPDLPALFLHLPPDPAVLDGLSQLLDDPAIVCARIVATGSTQAAELQPMVTALQSANIAVLLGQPALARQTQADGMHVIMHGDDDVAAIRSAIASFKPSGIVGVGGLKSRHAAMAAGELDIDYVMFGEPAADGFIPPLEVIVERASWWSELFTVPSVVFLQDPECIAAIVATGCDFIALKADTAAELRLVAGKAIQFLQGQTA